ncbi:MAG: hypothetical protein ACI8TP_002759 [Acidimicrobiales bacterium]|jgi:hypothetical protein
MWNSGVRASDTEVGVGTREPERLIATMAAASLQSIFSTGASARSHLASSVEIRAGLLVVGLFATAIVGLGVIGSSLVALAIAAVLTAGSLLVGLADTQSFTRFKALALGLSHFGVAIMLVP